MDCSGLTWISDKMCRRLAEMWMIACFFVVMGFAKCICPLLCLSHDEALLPPDEEDAKKSLFENKGPESLDF